MMAGSNVPHGTSEASVMKSLMTLLMFAFVLASVEAQDWVGFHGLERQGVGPSPLSALNWSSGVKTAWKTGVPGLGFSSPVVAGDRIYLTTAYHTEGGLFMRFTSSDDVISTATVFLLTLVGWGTLAVSLVLPKLDGPCAPSHRLSR